MSSTNCGWLKKRALTDNPKAAPEILRAMGENLLKEDSAAEAIMFFQAAGDQEALYKIADMAAEAGNFFIYNEVAKILGPEQTGQGRLQKLTDRAESLGLALYAESAKKYRELNFK